MYKKFLQMKVLRMNQQNRWRALTKNQLISLPYINHFLRSIPYNNMFYMLKKQEARVNRRNGEINDRSLQQTQSSSKTHPFQVKENAMLKDLPENISGDGIMKQRNQKEENFSQSSPSFIFGKHQYEPQLINKHLKIVHQGLLYSSLVLGTPSDNFLKQKLINLPQPLQPQDKKDKILMLDLDETLIHLVKDHQEAEVQLSCGSGMIRFNIRPFCHMFLQTVYVFTSAVESYARTVIDYLNLKSKYILGFLHRSHCLQTKRGLRIKDLRIIKNRDLSKIIIVDNLVHSFGLQLQNGIPILQFTNQKEDKQLLGLAKILRQIDLVQDVREFLTKKFQLRKWIHFSEEIFLHMHYENYCGFLKERKTIG